MDEDMSMEQLAKQSEVHAMDVSDSEQVGAQPYFSLDTDSSLRPYFDEDHVCPVRAVPSDGLTPTSLSTSTGMAQSADSSQSLESMAIGPMLSSRGDVPTASRHTSFKDEYSSPSSQSMPVSADSSKGEHAPIITKDSDLFLKTLQKIKAYIVESMRERTKFFQCYEQSTGEDCIIIHPPPMWINHVTRLDGFNILTTEFSPYEKETVDTAFDKSTIRYEKSASNHMKITQILRDQFNAEFIKQHTNIQAISPGKFVVSNHGEVTAEDCIHVYVLKKGYIPKGEGPLPKQVSHGGENFSVKVFNGYVQQVPNLNPEYFMRPLEEYYECFCHGLRISPFETDTHYGTLGLFAYKPEHITGDEVSLSKLGYITAGHVCKNVGQRVMQPYWSDAAIRLGLDPTIANDDDLIQYVHGSVCTRYIGNVELRDSGKMYGVDAAFVSLDVPFVNDFELGSPHTSKVRNTFPKDPTLFLDLGLEGKISLSGIVREADLEQASSGCLYKYGATSGLTAGRMNEWNSKVRCESYDGMLENQILVEALQANNYKLLEPGDSGACLFTSNGNVLGIVHSLLNSVFPVKAIVSPIEAVAYKLGLYDDTERPTMCFPQTQLLY